ncbi:uncharacterized protein LOC122083581 isoform X2 [Macadamia integrifolia]|uniref:uncharacterized protein LOC122083581 isoform X2 n=1 Tax=Macadamia integrifolia TaxID=60698 RepID=UPI001C4EF3B2|nr:uncharacterized protein LOC122083581 isoform X2 [Macadamia integrifolia]
MVDFALMKDLKNPNKPLNLFSSHLGKLESPVVRYAFFPPHWRIASASKLAAASSIRCASSPAQRPLRLAVLGAGFAGLSVAWHLLELASKDLSLCIDIYDEVGIGGGASGVAGGLVHPYSPKAKLLWKGAECWKECLKLLNISEASVSSRESKNLSRDNCHDELLVWRRGILRPATTLRNVDILNENCLGECRIESIDKEAASNLIPNMCMPYNSAIYMPEAININPQPYLKALFFACKKLTEESTASGYGGKKIYLHKMSVNRLLELGGEYNAVIICLGAKADMLPELSGKLPLRTCRGVIAHLQLPQDIRDEYGEHSPSILSDAWIAARGRRNLVMGSTWEWRSRNYSPNVSADEASMALEELVPKVSAVYPGIQNWTLTEARAGVRAMPPKTPIGSLPLLGCIDDFVNGDHRCKHWLFGGLGSRGLLYHAWLGKIMAQAVLSCNESLIPSELTSWRKLQ